MIAKNITSTQYIGPKALFDPNFVPPELLFRKKEEESLYSILKDSLNDDFCMNILYQGIEGIGKKAIVNKVLNNLEHKNLGIESYCKIIIDCKEKTIDEIMFSIILKLAELTDLPFNIDSLLSSNLSKMWSVFKLLTKKLKAQIIIILNNSEYIKPNIFKKILTFSKTSNITVISTVNKILRTSTMDLLAQFDLKRKLKYYSFHELYKIFDQRSKLGFARNLQQDLIYFLTDLVFEHYVPVPGKGIDIMRDLYPILSNSTTLDQSQMVEICQNHFDSFKIDEFSLLTYISEEDLITMIFLDNLCNYFGTHSKNFYIPSKQLKNLYDLSCESLEYPKLNSEYSNLLNALNNIGILSFSKKNINSLDNTSEQSNEQNYFIVVSPLKIKAMIDAIFGQMR